MTGVAVETKWFTQSYNILFIRPILFRKVIYRSRKENSRFGKEAASGLKKGQ